MPAPTHPRDRQIGRIGTAARIVLGAAFVIVPIAFGGIQWLDVVTLAAYGAIATATVAVLSAGVQHRRLSRLGTGLGLGLECCLVAILVAEAAALGAAIPANLNVVVGAFLGVSMLLAAARGDSGCELTALPNAITGRRDHIGCLLFSPLDAADDRRQS